MDEVKDTRDATCPVNYVTEDIKNKPATECTFCSYEHAPKHCPAYGNESRKCGKINHFRGKVNHFKGKINHFKGKINHFKGRHKQHKYVMQIRDAGT